MVVCFILFNLSEHLIKCQLLLRSAWQLDGVTINEIDHSFFSAKLHQILASLEDGVVILVHGLVNVLHGLDLRGKQQALCFLSLVSKRISHFVEAHWVGRDHALAGLFGLGNGGSTLIQELLLLHRFEVFVNLLLSLESSSLHQHFKSWSHLHLLQLLHELLSVSPVASLGSR